MKKLIITFFAVCALCELQASNGQTYHVDNSGCVSVGSCKISKHFKSEVKGFFNVRKPSKAEISDHNFQKMNDTSTFWFK